MGKRFWSKSLVPLVNWPWPLVGTWKIQAPPDPLTSVSTLPSALPERAERSDGEVARCLGSEVGKWWENSSHMGTLLQNKETWSHFGDRLDWNDCINDVFCLKGWWTWFGPTEGSQPWWKALRCVGHIFSDSRVVQVDWALNWTYSPLWKSSWPLSLSGFQWSYDLWLLDVSRHPQIPQMCQAQLWPCSTPTIGLSTKNMRAELIFTAGGGGRTGTKNIGEAEPETCPEKTHLWKGYPETDRNETDPERRPRNTYQATKHLPPSRAAHVILRHIYFACHHDAFPAGVKARFEPDSVFLLNLDE